MKQLTTLSIVRKDDMVLLAMKKRGFGEGWWNGYGGKVEEGEEIENAMLRELFEESGIQATKYEKRAIINFIFQSGDNAVEMHVYEIFNYEGEVVETEEMSPKWFKISEIPYD